MKSVCDITPYSPLKALLVTRFMLIFCLGYSSTLKMEASCSSETSVNFQWTARHYIPGDIYLI
jgi:hypothetical protein